MSRTTNETTIELSGRWLLETDKAVRFRVDKLGQRKLREPAPYWFPLSQVSGLIKQPLEEEMKLDTVRVKEWLVQKNGMYDKLEPAVARAPEEKIQENYDGFEDDIPF